MIGEIIIGVLAVAGIGTYGYLRGEKWLDRAIELVNKVRGGYFKKSNPNERCKACGHKYGVIAWNPELERLMHECQVCGATWPELPRVPAHLWDVLGKMIKFNRDNAQDVKEVFARANAPIDLKKKTVEAGK